MSFESSNESLDLTNAVWDDGEWMSWIEINRYVEEEAAEAEAEECDRPERDEERLESVEHHKSESSPEILERLMNLIRQAQAALEKEENIGCQIGEIGEVFAEAKLGMKRHRPYAQGSDGKIGNDFVEVKTISPWKKKHQVRVKRSGHWRWLVIVRISARWIFETRTFDRKQLGQGKGGKHVTVSWKPGRQTVVKRRDKAKVEVADGE